MHCEMRSLRLLLYRCRLGEEFIVVPVEELFKAVDYAVGLFPREVFANPLILEDRM